MFGLGLAFPSSRFLTGPSVPVLAMAGSWTSSDTTPDFTATLDPRVTTGDSFRLQIQTSGGDWLSPLSDVTHSITSGESGSHTVDLAGSALPDGTYQARCNVTHGTTSAWSNVVSFTITTYDTATTAWINAVVGGGGSVSATQAGYVDTLIHGLKTDGLFATMDAMWLLASESETQAKYDIIAAGGSNLATTKVGSPTFTASQGYAAGVANTDYLTTTYIPSSSKVNLTQNSATVGTYVRTAQSTRHCLFGAGDASAGLTIEQFRNASQVSVAINDAGAAMNVSGYTVGAAGLHVSTRTAAGANAFYFNGTSRGTNTTASVALPTKAMFILTQNQNGSPGNGGTEQVSIFFIASGWDATKNANFYTRVQNYMTSLGTQV